MALKLIKNDQAQTVENDIFKGLNKEQSDAVNSLSGPVLVVAGAGSGKTRVLTHRIAHLIQNGVSASNILALTFTNKAAEEMKIRLSNLMGADIASRLWAGTFHSIFARILRYEANHLGYTSSFSIYDTDDSLGVIKKVFAQFGFNPKDLSPQMVHSSISRAKNRMMKWNEYFDAADNAIEKQIAEVFREYNRKLLESNAMDFDDLLLNIIRLLESFPDIRNKYSNMFKYILVDEYQDTNRAQYKAISLLASVHRNIFAVGDDAQSIYRWRGAEIRNILDFQKDFASAKTIKLEQNYRSTKTILNAADSIIKQNKSQLKKTLWTDNQDGELIEVIECSDDREESETIADLIKSHKTKHKYSYRDFAVLYRTNAQSLSLESALRKLNIPYIIIGGTSFYKRKEIKDTLAYLKLLVNPKDNESLERSLNEPPRGIGATSIKYIREFANRNSVPMIDAFRQSSEIEDLQERARRAALLYSQFIDRFSARVLESSQGELLSEYIKESGLLDMYKEMGTDDALDRLNNIHQLLSSIREFLRQNDENTIEGYLQQISLVSDIDVTDTKADSVRLMTLHSAKGLEFPVVFIAGMEQGLFPIVRAEQHPEEQEEERRLFYVGITRAEVQVFLTYTKRRMRFGEYASQSPSVFLMEIDQKYLLWKKKNRVYQAQRLSMPVKKEVKHENSTHIFDDIPPKEVSISQIPHKEVRFKTGDMVRHNQFGIGRIESIIGIGTSKQATVEFTSIGKKKLLLYYAKLDLVKSS